MMAQFCYLSLYFSAETVSCKDGRGLKHEKIGSIFSSSNAMPAKIMKNLLHDDLCPDD